MTESTSSDNSLAPEAPPEAPPEPDRAARAFFRAFRHRNYRLFFGGQIISLVGTWMQSVAQSWLIYQLTGSATLLGLSSFFGQLPVFLMAPIGGVVADAADRRKILLATQAVSMVLALALSGLTFAVPPSK